MNDTTNTNFIATDSDDHAAGVITYWRLSNTHIDAHGLIGGLARHDIDEHAPSLPSPRTAKRRAVSKFRAGDLFVRSGPAGATLLVEQDGDEFTVTASATLNAIGQIQVECDDDELRDAIADAYTDAFNSLDSRDISTWLLREAVECDALSLRDTGGVYFVPGHAVERWHKIADVLRENSTCRVHTIPAMRTDDAVASILDALTEECEAFSAAMDEALSDEDLGARAMRTRADKADALLAKLTRYEGLLGDRMVKIAEQVEAQRANAIMVALTKEGE